MDSKTGDIMNIIGTMIVLLFMTFSGCSGQQHGPVFLQEPPQKMVFSNNTGASASCSAHGFPPPTVTWVTADDSQVTTIPGLRTVMENGTLIFSPFPGQEYRQDVHAAIYRCKAVNPVGLVVSRDMQVTAVVWQDWSVHVGRSRASIGGIAVLSCIIPFAVNDYVSVTAWYKDETMLLPGPPEEGAKYVMTGTNLLIRDVQVEDSRSRYACATENTLTNERRKSFGMSFEIFEFEGSSSPRFIAIPPTEVLVKRGSDVHVTCVAEGNPTPTITWFREVDGVLRALTPTARITWSPGILSVRRAQPMDTGRYTCKVSNAMGERTRDTRILITQALTIKANPPVQTVNTGDTANVSCTITGTPMGVLEWLRNGRFLAGVPVDGYRAPMEMEFYWQTDNVARKNAGMYQCVMRNGLETVQGSAEVRLGDTNPELQYTFIEQVLRPGPSVSLRCTATANPQPRFQWLLDGQLITSMTGGQRYQIGQFIGKNGEVVGHLNISGIRSEDGGLYTCKAANALGEASHSARLNIYGPPYVRSMGPVRAVSGRELTINCPYAGYPINSVKWEKVGTPSKPSPTEEWMRVDPIPTFKIDKVDASHAGGYTCIVNGPDGQQARRDIQVIVSNPPEIEPFSFPSNLQEGRRAQVSCSVTSGDMPVYFSWYKDDAPIPASLQVEERGAEFFSNLVFKDVTSRHSGQYTCIASNSAAKVNYTADLYVKVPPKWDGEPVDTSALAGTVLVLHCRTTGSPNPRITWLKKRGPPENEFIPLINVGRYNFKRNGTLLIEEVSSNDEGEYMCKAENGVGIALSKVINVAINDPARFEVPSKNVTARRNEPITLVCDVIGDNPIQVQWTHNMNKLDLNTYRLSTSEVKTDSGLRSQLFIGRADRQDSGIYKCQAVNAYGHSDHFIYLSVQERPDVPHSLMVIEVGSHSVRLGWIQSFDGNAPLLGYSLQVVPLADFTTQTPPSWSDAITQNISVHSLIKSSKIIDAQSGTHYEAIVSGLRPFTKYAIRIQALNVIDSSQFTEPVMMKTQEEAPSEPPQNVQVLTGGSGELRVIWMSPPRDTWNGELLGYMVNWQELLPGLGVGNSTKTMTVNGWSAAEVTITGLRKYTRYTVTVKAFNSVAAGPPSPSITATTLEGVPEAAPLDVSCIALSAVSIKVAWQPPPAEYHGGLILGYKVLYTPQLDDHVEHNVGDVKRLSITETYLHGLHKYMNYSIQVLAYTNAGDGKRSHPTYCMTDEDMPSPPLRIKALAVSGEAILVSWLAPLNPNGIITHYTVYHREAGRIGKHITYTVTEDNTKKDGLKYEIRNVAEHQLYEFWVSASTRSGEGEPTSIIAQSANTRAPARIASFSETIRKPISSSVTLLCLAVGSPVPRSRWLHRSVTVTHTPHYQVTPQGNLLIHSIDTTSSGNFTCTASNLYGEDSITYTVIAIMPPSAPSLGLQYTTSSAIKVHWQSPNNGGSPILGYSLHYKPEKDLSWQTVELSSEVTTYGLENLKCGTLYLIRIQGHNRVAAGRMSEILSTSTRGSSPIAPKSPEMVSSNSSSIKLNLYTWRDGGCPITKLHVEYRNIGESLWTTAADGSFVENIVMNDLHAGQWYQLKLSVSSDAGTTIMELNVDTAKENGERIPPLDPGIALAGAGRDSGSMGSSFLLPVASAALLIAALTLLACILLKTQRLRCLMMKRYTHKDRKLSESNDLEREKLREGQKLYSSSSINGNEKSNDDSSELYEISPYATFGEVTAARGGARGSGGEHALHFRTFGAHENNEGVRLPSTHRKHRRLHRCDTFEYDESSLSKAMTVELRGTQYGRTGGGRAPSRGPGMGPGGWDRRSKHRETPTTDSDDNSDSPGNTTTKGSRCVSPVSGERSYTPGRLTRCSSGVYMNGSEKLDTESTLSSSPQPNTDNISKIAVPTDITLLIDKYHQRKEQERRECTIHV